MGYASPDTTPLTFIGGGRIGNALVGMGAGKDVIIHRDDPFPADAPPGPILVCTRNDSLDVVVERTPENRRQDLVFLQNGMLEPWLEKRGLADSSQVRRDSYHHASYFFPCGSPLFPRSSCDVLQPPYTPIGFPAPLPPCSPASHAPGHFRVFVIPNHHASCPRHPF